MANPNGTDENPQIESSSVSLGHVRRALFGSDERNINMRRGARRSLYDSLLAAEHRQQINAEVHHEDGDVLPDELPGNHQANSTQNNPVDVPPGASRTTGPATPLRNGGGDRPNNLMDHLDDIEEYPEEEGVGGFAEFSTPSNVFFRSGALGAGGFRPENLRHEEAPRDEVRANGVQPEGVRPPRRGDFVRGRFEQLYEKVFNLEQEKRKLLGDVEYEKNRRGDAERERNNFRDLLEDAYVEAQVRHEPRQNETVRRYLDLKGALQMVRNFAGENSDKLDCFLQSVESAKKLIHPELQEFLLEGILGSKLEGNAMKQMKHRAVTTFHELKTELESLFGKTKNLVGLQMEFSRLQQRDNEDVVKFVNRTEEVTLDYQNGLLALHNELSEGEKLAAKTVLSTMAKLMFEQGLRGQLQILVRANNYKTLHESCAGAIELEKTISGAHKNKNGGNAAPQRNSTGGNRAGTRLKNSVKKTPSKKPG